LSAANCSSTVASMTVNGTANFASSSAACTGVVPGVTATTIAGTGLAAGGYLYPGRVVTTSLTPANC
jgi:hypothetical protein